MNKNVVILGVIVVLAVLGGIVLFRNSKSPELNNINNGANMNDQKSTFEIKISNSTFEPSMLTVKAGQSVTVTNLDIMGHSVTADNGEFDTSIIANGETVTLVAPTVPGTYTYHCIAHPNMKGTLVVE